METMPISELVAELIKLCEKSEDPYNDKDVARIKSLLRDRYSRAEIIEQGIIV